MNFKKIALAGVICLTAFAVQAQVNMGTNFRIMTNLPIDTRAVVADLTARDAINSMYRYEGLSVFVISTGINYQLIGGTSNSNWQAVGIGSVYDAGTGLTLTGTTFSANNTAAIWNANQLNGTSISTVAPSSNQVLQWNGSAWAPANDANTIYDAGTGITLSSNSFFANNTSAIWNANQLNGSTISTTAPSANQVLRWNGSEWVPASETAYTSGTGITISGTTIAADYTSALWNANQIMGYTISTSVPDTDQVLKWDGANWIPAADDKANFAAGFGLLLSGNTFYANNSASIWSASDIQGKPVSVTSPNPTEVLKWNGTSWAPAADNNTTYSAGTGLLLNGTTFSANNTSSIWNANQLQGQNISATPPTMNQSLKWDGFNWLPTDEYATGTGLVLNNNTFFVQNTSPIWNANQLNGTTISTTAPASNEVLKWNGTEWAPATDNNNAYAAGTGITLSGNTFSADNTSPIWNANQLNGTTISTTAPASNEVLKWNGTEWAPATDDNNAYTAGTGITLSGNTFSADNTSPIWNANQLNGTTISTTAPASNQVLKWNGSEWAPSNEIAYDAGTGITLSGNTFSANNTAAIWNAYQIMGYSISTSVPDTDQVLKWDGASWIPAADDKANFAAGWGLLLSGNTFYANTSASIWSASDIQGKPVSVTSPNPTEVLKWNGTAWAPSADNNTLYSAGTGLLLSGTTFTANNTSSIWNANQLQGQSISATPPTMNQSLKWDGFNWLPTDEYATGTGLVLSSNTFFVQSTSPIWNANQIMGSTISTTAPASNQVLKWNGTEWSPEDENLYDAGLGITLSGNTFSHAAHTGDALGSTSLTVVALQGRSVATTSPSTGEFLGWNGTAWIPTVPASNPYEAGTGLTLSGNTFSADNTVAIWNANQLNGTSISTTAPGSNQVLKWNGTEWAPASDDNNIYDAGLGITLSGNTFSHMAHTGDVTGTTSITVIALQGRTVATTAPSTGEFLGWNGTSWIPTVPASNPYEAGTGLTLSGNTFNADNTLAIWNANQLNGSTISTTAPSSSQVLKWNGSEWAPAADDNNTYDAGTGLALTGNTFINTGDLSSINEIQNLGYTPATRALDITSGTGISLPLFSTTSTDAGLVTGSNSGGAGVFLNGSGTWSAPVGTTYSAGVGLTLSGSTFSALNSSAIWNANKIQGVDVSTIAPASNQILKWNGTAWAPANETPYSAGTGLTLSGTTFSANNTSSIWNADQIQGNPVLATVPTANQVIKWNGTAWAPANDNNNTYVAGTGLSLSGNTFINTGDLSSVNEIQNLSYTSATRALDISSGTGVTLPLFATTSTDAGLVPGSNSGGAGVFLNGSGTWSAPVGTTYDAGLGITLNSNTFSHTAHTGDATGITSLTVVALQGRSVDAAAPASNQILKWNGTAWAPATDDNTLYDAGTGLSLSGNTFINTGDLSSVNEIQDLVYTAATRALDISSGTGVTLPLFATTSTDAGLVPGSNSGGAGVFLNGSGTWSAPVGTTYDAGLGITLNSNTFSHTPHTGDATGITSLTVVALQGRSVDAAAPASNQILKWNGTAWAPATDDNTLYDAGTGLSLSGNTFINTGDLSSANEIQNLAYTSATRALDISSGTGVTLPLFATTSTDAGLVPGSSSGGAGVFLNGSGTWSAPVGTTYDAGLGITLNSNTFSHTPHTGDATGITSLTVVALQGRSVDAAAPSSNQILKWNGTAWAPSTDDNTLYDAGTGLTLSGNTFINTGDLSSANELQNLSYSASTRDLSISSATGVNLPLFNTTSTNAGLVPGSNNAGVSVFLDGSGSWSVPVGTTYSAGTGLLLSGTTFSANNTSSIWNANQLQGNAISLSAPGANQVLKWNGASWGPANDNNTTYAAGTGLTLSGNTFSHTAHTGDATGSTALTVVALQGNAIAAAAPASNQVLKWNGSAWTPTDETAYSAGTGLTLSGNTFSANNTVAIWNANQLNGSTISTLAPSSNQVLKWNGTDWAPATDDNNTYDAGAGLSLSGNTFINTGDLSSVNEIQDLVYTAATRALDISSGTGVTLPLFATTSTDAGLVPGSNSGGAGVFLNGSGTWSAPVGTTYDAGIGITLNSNTFSHTPHTGDATGTTSLTVVAIQGRSVDAAAPSSNQILKWNGTAWAPSTDDNNFYAAGTGLSLSGNTFSHLAHTGDATGSTTLTVIALQGNAVSATSPTSNQVLKWNGSAWTPTAENAYAAGTGLTLSGNTFDANNTAAIWNANQLNGSSVSTIAPSSSQVLKWNGTVWAPTNENAYAAGSGLSLSGNTFINTGDLSSINELQDLLYTAATRSLSITSATGVTIPLFATTSTDGGLVPGSNFGGATVFLNGAGGWSVPAGTTYSAGTGLSLSSNVFSANNTTAIWNANQLVGNTISTVAPASSQVLKWNGSAWTPTNENSYVAGTGLSLSGNTFTANNTAAIWNANLLNGNILSTTAPSSNQVLKWNGTEWAPTNENAYDAGTGLTLTGNTLSHAAHTGDAIGSTSLTVIALLGRGLSTTAPNTGEFLGWNGTSWVPTVPASNPYAAGTGITLTGNTFSANNTAAIWNANQLNGNTISTIAPASNEVLKWNGTAWTPATDGGSAYDAGSGITLAGNTFSHGNHAGDVSGATTLTVIAIQGRTITTTAPNSGEFLGWNGSSWVPTVPASNPYTAGTGLSLTGNTFSANNTSAIWNANQLNGVSVSTVTPSSNQILKWNGSAWTPANETPYSAGTGLSLSGTTFSANNTSSIWNANQLQGFGIDPSVPSSNQILKWNGSIWALSNDLNNSYAAGNGLSLSGTTFSANSTSAIWNANQLQGYSVTATAPATNQILKWNGTTWALASDDDTPYTAGLGITLNANTFSHTAHTGDATGTTSITVVAIQGRGIDATAPTSNQILKWNGSSWAPADDANSAYAAGTGLTLTSNTFTANNTSAIWNANQLNGTSISTTSPTNNQILKWNGTAWTPAPDDNNSYAAGSGLALSGNTFSNTGDLSSANELQNLSYTAATRSLGIASATGVTLPLFTAASDGLTPLSGGGTANFLRADGTWTAPVGTNYAAGTGLTLSGNTFSATNTVAIWNANQLNGSTVSTTAPSNSQVLKWNGSAWTPTNENAYAAGTGLSLSGNTISHAVHTGDATGTTSLTVVAIQGRAISTNAPAANQVLRWNGSTWLPGNETPYSAGTGLSISGTTFSANNTSSLWNANKLQGNDIDATLPTGGQVLKWNGSAWAPGADDNTFYSAGTGLSLSGTVFSANNTSSIWNANQLQGNAISATAPTSNQILKWNGTAWTPATENAYAAGNGISLSGNTFSNTGDLSSANELQNLSYTAATRTLGIASATGVTLPLFNATADGLTPLSGGGTANFLRADGTWSAPAGTTYTAGNGLALSGTTFSALNSNAIWNANQLQGIAVSTTTPGSNQILKWNGTAWSPANETPYSAGTGLTLSGTTFSANNTSSIWNANQIQGFGVDPSVPSSNQILKWNGSIWALSNDLNNSYAAGNGLSLSGTTFSANSSSAIWNANQLQGYSVTAAAPATNQILKWNGTTWALASDDNSTYAAGLGITLNSNTFSHTAHSGDATGTTSLTVVALQGRSVDATAPASNQILKWNGSAWAPATDDNTLYAAGTGIALSGNTFSNTGDLSSANELQNLSYTAATRSLGIASATGVTLPLFNATADGLTPLSGGGTANFLRADGSWSAPVGTNYAAGTGLTLTGNTFSHTAHTGDATGNTALTVVALQGVGVSATAPASTQVLRYNGTSWIPSNETAYAAGTGIALSGTTFSNTGDLSSANELQNLSYTAATRSLGIASATGVTLPLFNATADGLTPLSGGGTANFLRADGSWSAPVGTNYAAGTGLTLTGNTFSHTAHTGDATGTTALTVVALQGVGVSATAPASTQVLRYNGTSWIPSNETAYAAGTGIALSGTTFTNTGDLSSANELQNLSYTAATRSLGIASATGVTLPLFNATADGLTPLSGGGTANFLRADGSWSAPVGTNYAAGTGLTLTGNTFSHTAHTGDATGNTALTVVALQGVGVSATAPASTQVLRYNGTSWIPSNETAYAAGTGIALSGNTFSNTGDLSSANELQNLSYTAATRSLGIASATGVTLPLFNATADGLTPLSGGGTANFLRADGTWTAPVGTTYAAGTGISLSGNTFSNTGDLSSANELQNLSYTAATRSLGIASATGVTLPLFNATADGLTPLSGGGTTNFLRADGTWIAPVGTNYVAGTGLTLTGNTFSHTAHTGDATGTTALTVVALQGVGVSATTPTSTQVLRYNGTSWIPSNETAYAAGTGIALSGTTFSNTGDLSSANELQNLSYTAATRSLGIASATGVTLPLFNATADGLTPLSGGGTANFLRADGSWSAPVGTNYAAGTGLTLTGNTFSHTAHTGDATGTTALTVVALQGVGVSATAPASTQVLRYNGTSWIPSNETAYAAGTGIALSGTTFSNTGDLSSANELQNLSYTAATRSLGIASATGVTLPLFNATADGLTPLSGGGTANFLRADGTWSAPVGTNYAAGTGLTLTGNTFSHTAHTGDATGTTALTVVALQGVGVSATAPASTQVLRYNGTSWIPSNETAYAAGTGIALSGTTFSNTGDLSSTNELQNLSYTAATRSLGIASATGVTLPLFNATADGLTPLSGGGTANFLRADGTWSAPVGTNYAAGTGLTLTGNTFSHTAHTGDATGTTALTVVALQGVGVSATAPASTQVLRYNGTSWIPSNETAYAAGTGIALSGTTFSNTGDLSSTNELQNLSYTAATRSLGIASATGVTLPLFNATADGLTPLSGGGTANFLRADGSWSAPVGTTYAAGLGITLTTNTFSHTAHTGDATGTTSLTVVAIQNRSVSVVAPALNEILKWNGAAWAPATDNSNTYAAGTGLTLSGNTFFHAAHTGDATGTTSLTVVAIQSYPVSAAAPLTNEVLKWNGATWIPGTDLNNTYAAGTGLSVSGNTFVHTAHTGDATGASSLTVVAIQGRSVSAVAPLTNEVLKWNGTSWIPQADNNNTYDAGTGLTLSANTFFHTPHTGDATGTTSLSVVAIRGRSVSGVAPAVDEVLKWNGATWLPQADNNNTYDAGSGITLSANSFFHTAHSGDATGATTLTVVGIRGRNISALAPAIDNILKWNGASWAPVPDNNNMYDAGTGLLLASGTFFNTGDLSTINELQNLSYTAATRTINITTGTGTILPLFATTSTDAGLVPGSNNGGATVFLNGAGAWTAPVGTTYAAGTGLTLSGTTFSHTAHTGDATGSTALTVVALQGVSVSTIAPSNTQLLKYNGSSWVPANETAYAAGLGVTLSGTTFSHTAHTGDATGTTSLTVVALQGKSVSTIVPSNNQVLRWNNALSYWAPANETPYSAGTGLSLSGTTFSANNTSSIWNADKLQGNNVSATGPAAGEVLKWDGTVWAPAADINTFYAAGTGLSLTGTTFSANNTSSIWNANQLQGVAVSNTAPTNLQLLRYNGTNWIPSAETSYSVGLGLTLSGTTFSHTAHTGDATGSTSLTVVAIQGRSVLNNAPAANDLLKWNGAAWAPAAETAYAVGTGLSLSGNTFSANNTVAIWNANQLQGSSVSTTAPSNNQILKWTGSDWTPADETAYDVGTGLSLTGNTFSANNSVAIWNANQLQGSSVSTTAPTNNQILKWTGSDWTPTAETAYDVGLGITLSSNTFSHTAHTGDATGITSLTVVAIQGVSVSTNAPANTQILRYDGTNWTPSDETAYDAGTGLSLAGGTFTNTGDLSVTNELQDLSYTVATRALDITSGTRVTLPLYATTSTDAGLVPGSNSGGASVFLNGAGAWSTPVGTTYAAGTGITLSSNTFSHTAHTGDATGTTSLTVVALQGRSVSATAPGANEILKWNGAAWTPAADANTTYASGTGITLSSNTFSHTAHTGDATGSTSLTVVALRGISISTTAPTNSQVLRYNGTSWAPSTETGYAAGLGITLSGTTFSHTAHTGDATGTTSLTVVALQGRSIATTIPTSGNMLGWDGSSWLPTNNGLLPSGTSGQTLRHDGTNWVANSFIWSSGTQVGIGTTAPSAGITLEVNGRIKTATIYESSDIRYKDNVKPITNALDKTLALQGVFYTWKPEYAKANNLSTDEKMIGLIAQDAEKVMPEIVMTDQNGYKSIRYSNVVGLLIEAIKEQNKQIEQLKAAQLEQNKKIDELMKQMQKK